MTKHEKRVAQFLARPESLRYEEIKTILVAHGFVLARKRGSHNVFKHPAMGPMEYLTIPLHGKDCKPYYKRQAAFFLHHIVNHLLP